MTRIDIDREIARMDYDLHRLLPPLPPPPEEPPYTANGDGGDGSTTTPPPTPGPQPPRPHQNITNTADAADWLRKTIGTGPLAGMLNRSGEIVHTPREGEEGYIPPKETDDHDGPAQIRQVTANTLASRISYTYNCYKTTAKGETTHALFPVAAARTAVDVPDMLPHLRTLRGVTHTPIVRRDGTVLATPGYDPGTNLLYLPDPELAVPAVPEHPTNTQTADALALIEQMIVDFDFVTDHDRANYLGLLITPLLRELYPPPYKLGAITAPQPGSGKSLLAAIMRIIHGGVFRAEIPTEDGELRKQITAILDVTTGPVVQFDNVTGVLRSSTLAGLLTSNRWDDRRLGVTEMVSRSNDRLWIMTGNNVALGGDIPRRAICVTIDPAVPNPHLRTGFQIRNLEQWAYDRRGDLIAAMLTIVRGWVAAGRPTNTRGSDGYAHWVGAITGILEHAGVPGTFDHIDTNRTAEGVDDSDWRDLLAAAWQTFGDIPFTARELLDKVHTSDTDDRQVRPIPVDALPGDMIEKALRNGTRACAKSLGRWLANKDGRWAGEFTVRSIGENRSHQKIWKVEVSR